MADDLKASFRSCSRQNLAKLHKQKELFFDKKVNALMQNLIISLLNCDIKNPLKCGRFYQSGRFHSKWQNLRLSQRYFNQHRFRKIARKSPINVLIYIPLDLEVDIFPLIFSLKKQKHIKIFSPFILKNGENKQKTFKIVPFRLPLKKTKFNICEAGDSTALHFNKIDIAIVPILGLDCEFSRVGFGKGMYDRFYSSLKRRPINIFVSRILHFSNAKFGDFYDIKGDFIVASRGRKYDLRSDWVKRDNLVRPFILHRKEILYKRAEADDRTSQNQS